MNINTLYEIYTINKQTPGEDLTISLAKFQAEHPGAVSHEEAKTIREFIGKHGETLAVAFCVGKPANKKSSPKQDLSEEKFTGSR